MERVPMYDVDGNRTGYRSVNWVLKKESGGEIIVKRKRDGKIVAVQFRPH